MEDKQTQTDFISKISIEHQSILFEYKAKFPNSLTAKIIDLILESHLFDQDNFLEYDERFCMLDYIDGIRADDMKKSIMWGIDSWRRLFVAIRKTAYVEEINSSDSDSKCSAPFASNIVETFFQRYCTDGNIWTSGTAYSNGAIEIIKSTMRDASVEYETFKNLVLHGKALHCTISLLSGEVKNYRLVCK